MFLWDYWRAFARDVRRFENRRYRHSFLILIIVIPQIENNCRACFFRNVSNAFSENQHSVWCSANGRQTAVCRPWSKVVSTDRKTPVSLMVSPAMSFSCLLLLFLNTQQDFHLLIWRERIEFQSVKMKPMQGKWQGQLSWKEQLQPTDRQREAFGVDRNDFLIPIGDF